MRFLPLLLILTGCAFPIGVARTTQEQAKAAVKVESMCGDLGSGVITGPGLVVTAYHIFETCGIPGAIITLPSGEQFIATVDVTLRDPDLARLRTLVRTFRAKVPRVGIAVDKICFEAAYPERSRSCGGVESVANGEGGVRHEALTVGGNSGSGVYNQAGELVGVVVRRFTFKTGGRATALVYYDWLVTAP